MLVHSFLYYEMDTNIIDDATWSKWGVELAELQKKYPKEAEQVEYAELFRDWDGSSGAHLKYDDAIKSVAYRLYCKQWGLTPQIAKSKSDSVKSPQNQIQDHKVKEKSATRSLF